MPIKNLLLTFLIFSGSIQAQNTSELVKEYDLKRHFNKLVQRTQLNENTSLKKIVSSLKQSQIITQNDIESTLWLVHNFTFQKWASSSWQNDSSQIYDYNQDFLLSETSIRDWISNQWVDQCRYLYDYDQWQRKVSQKFQVYISNIWIDSSKKTYEYNYQGLLSTETTYHWNNGGWENQQLISLTYYNNGEPDQDVYQVWENNSWVNSERTVYEYYPNSIIIRFDIWLFESWINLLRIVANYDSNGLLYEIKIQIWLFGWENLLRSLYEFDNYLNIKSILNQEWDYDISDWVDYSRITPTYTPENLPKTSLEERWSANSYWINYFLRIYNYDGFQNQIETIGQSWNGNGWSNSEREVFDYVVSTEDEPKSLINDYELVGNYPNPFNPTTTIQFHIPEISEVTLKIYNSIGEEIIDLLEGEMSAGDYKIRWNAEGFNSGIYFYHLKAGNFVETKKMVLIK